jgi:outer membrane protein assembly factor BamB
MLEFSPKQIHHHDEEGSEIMLNSNFALAATILCAFMNLAGAQEPPEVIWSYAPDMGGIDTSAAIGDVDGAPGNEVVVAGTAGEVTALSATGAVLWIINLPGPLSITPTVADICDDAAAEVLVLNNKGTLYCLEGRTGVERWVFPMPREISWGATAVVVTDTNGDGTQDIILGDSGGGLACVSGEGRLLDMKSHELGSVLCPTVGDVDGDARPDIVLGGSESPVLCLHASDGKQRWRVEGAGQGASPVLANILGDEKLEIIGAVDEAVTAFSAEGDVLWSYGMHQKLDSAITVADADNDGELEIYAADLLGYFVCLSATGDLRWDMELGGRVRRSPTVGDVDGDGVNEILVAGYTSAVHVFDPTGKLEQKIALGGPSNGSAVLADLSGDGTPSMVCTTSNKGLQVFRWSTAQPNATLPWPEYRGDSFRTACMEKPVAITRFDGGRGFVGLNICRVEVENPQNKKLTVALFQSGGLKSLTLSHKRIVSSDSVVVLELPYSVLVSSSQTLFRLHCSVKDETGRQLLERHELKNPQPVEAPLEATEGTLDALEKLCAQLRDPRLPQGRIAVMRMQANECRAQVDAEGPMPQAEKRRLARELRVLAEESDALLAVVKGAVQAQADGDSSIVACAANPWAPFGGMQELAEGRFTEDNLQAAAFAGETESVALNVFNLGGETRVFRVMPGDITQGDSVVSWKETLSLHEVIDIPAQSGQQSPDALPELNQGQLLIVPAWEARQLWININTDALKPGAWNMPLLLRSVDGDDLRVETDLNITVWDAALPEEQPLRLCHWGYVHSSVLKDQPEAAVADQVAHGTNVFVGLFYPRATYDETGAIVGEIDFTAHDAYIKQYGPHGMILFCGYQGALKGPVGQDSEAYGKAHVTWLRAWVAHLKELGVDYADFALYPVDEPGLQGNTELSRRYIRMAKLAREADPNIQMYTDPVEAITMEELEAMKDYVDIWCPNRGGLLLEENVEKMDFIRATGETLWTYECRHDAKQQTPLGYYRGQAWLAWARDLTGVGYWSYCTTRDDPWFRPDSGNDYLFIYQGKGVVSSKRWEAIRDGVEDYSMLDRLRAAAKKGGPDAEKAKKLLDEDASRIGGFCSLNPDETTPILSVGPAQARKIADEQWKDLQQTRAAVAQYLDALK